MATSLAGSVQVTSKFSYTNPNAIDTPATNPLIQATITFVQGTGANQASLIFYNQYTAVGSATTLTISALTDLAFGIVQDYTAHGVKAILIVNTTLTSGFSLKVGAAATHPFTSWLGGTTPYVLIGAGGFLCITAPVDTYASVSSTSDQLKIDPGANTVTFDVALIG